jgi:hypothetical protein
VIALNIICGVTSANSLNYLWYVCVFDKYLWITGLLIFLSLFWIILELRYSLCCFEYFWDQENISGLSGYCQTWLKSHMPERVVPYFRYARRVWRYQRGNQNPLPLMFSWSQIFIFITFDFKCTQWRLLQKRLYDVGFLAWLFVFFISKELLAIAVYIFFSLLRQIWLKSSIPERGVPYFWYTRRIWRYQRGNQNP